MVLEGGTIFSMRTLLSVGIKRFAIVEKALICVLKMRVKCCLVDVFQWGKRG